MRRKRRKIGCKGKTTGFSRRQFLKACGIGGTALCLPFKLGLGPSRAYAQIPGGTLLPGDVAKYATPLVKPPAMRRTSRLKRKRSKNFDYYEIAVKEFMQQILPNVPGVASANHPMTKVWSYGPAGSAPSLANGYFYPAFTIENKWRRPTVVKWVNGLAGKQHLLPVDPSLHWANPIGMRDMRPSGDPNDSYWGHSLLDPGDGRYIGPVPIVTHVHGAHTFQESDGYPEAWYLPAGTTGVNYTKGSFYDQFNSEFQARYGAAAWAPGTASFVYPNNQRATTLWYHDHTLGMTRLNVYAGPAGFWLIRGGPDDSVIDSSSGMAAVLPGPRPGPGLDPFGLFYEIPIAIQDRSFNTNGSLFYPDHRAFFEGLTAADFTDPNFFIPGNACGGFSDVSRIWQPEFFGNMMVVNGQTWPYLDVEPQLYRFRLLNGCNSRFLVLQFENPAVQVWQIGAEGGFLPAPVLLNDFPPDGVNDGTAKLLMGPAERADIIVDFRTLTPGASFRLLNLGPDEPFGGFPSPSADPASTGQVMEFRVVMPGPMSALPGAFTDPLNLVLPAITPPASPGGPYINPREVSLNEEESKTVFVLQNPDESWVTPVVLACADPDAVPFGPTAALLGTLNPDNTGNPLLWMDPVTENPSVGATETWEIHNFTMDAHPIHIHLVQFQVVDRQPMGGAARPPEAWETGFKDTVIAYPDEITRVQAKFDIAGQFVWHCHIVEHEDNEMMRPYRIEP